MNGILALIVGVISLFGLTLLLGLTWLVWTVIVEALRALATWILAQEAERVMSLEGGPERSDRAKRLLASLSRFDAATSGIYIPPVRHRLVLLVAYGLVVAVMALATTQLRSP